MLSVFTMNVFVLCTIITMLTLKVNADYWQTRASLIKTDQSQNVGSSIVLNPAEEEVNKILMNFKLKEIDVGFVNPAQYLAAQHFFKAKTDIEKSEVFKFIRRLPKGTSLHSHDMAAVSEEYLYSLTFKDNLYGCVDVNGRLKLHFFNNVTNDNCNWTAVSKSRQEDENFDKFLKSQMTLIVEDPSKLYPDINKVWSKFMDIFGTVAGLICYKPVFQEYFYQVLEELYDDNVMYIEFRGILPEVYDLDGTIYSPVEVAELYVKTLLQFKEDHDDFHGARFIYAPVRKVGNDTFEEYTDTLKKLQTKFPEFIAGFDLVGQEDLGLPLISFIPQLLELKKQTKFFFHAGETNWFGETTDMNLFDAVLLNTTRIGHGYGILKHPELQKLVKQRDIALEISPISNQVLKLVDDIRNHPGNTLIAGGFPVVICCDDPSFWGAKGLSYDWYVAFMGMSSRNSDLKLLKQLAINSLKYSVMPEEEKIVAFQNWEKQWNQFIDEVLIIYDINSVILN